MQTIILTIASVFALIIFAIAYLRYRLANVADHKNLEAAIDAEVNKCMKPGLFPGMVVGVYKNGRAFIKGYGVVNKGSAQCPDAESVFQIGSLSKVLTALLLQKLCDQGVVSIDATLGELLGDKLKLAPCVSGVTLRQLATHTSGFPRIPSSFSKKVSEKSGGEDLLLNPYSYLDREWVLNYLANPEGKRKAGRFDYSNYGMGLLAHVLEIITGEDFEPLMQQKVLQPMGMNQTAIKLTAAMQEKLVQGYNTKGLPTQPWTFAALGGAGAYSSTAGDLMKFIAASVAKAGLASQLFIAMSKPQFNGDTGIGWIQASWLDRFIGNSDVVWHNGMVGGYASYLSIDKQTGTGVLVLANQAKAIDMLGAMLMRQARSQSWLAGSLSENCQTNSQGTSL